MERTIKFVTVESRRRRLGPGAAKWAGPSAVALPYQEEVDDSRSTKRALNNVNCIKLFRVDKSVLQRTSRGSW